MKIFLLFALAALPAWAEPKVPKFVNETATAGIDHHFTGDWEQITGGGVGVFDCNDDALPDVVLAGGTAPAQLFVNRSTPEALTFAAQESGVELTGVSGVYPIDINSDRVMDLMLLRVGENVLLKGQRNCRFTRANEDWKFDGGDAWSVAFSAMWEKGALFPTLAVGNYIDRKEEGFPWGSCTDNWLHRPQDLGYAPPIALTPSFCALSMLFTDWNKSGLMSLRISNDREYYKGGQEQLWHIEPGAPPRPYGPDEGWKPLKIWGMGIASADLDADGYPEYFLTSMADNKLQTLADPASGKPIFKDIAFAKGVIAQRPYVGEDIHPSTAWHAQFEDVNNDGLVDLFIAKGNVTEMPDFALKDPNNLLLQREDGTFFEAGALAGVDSTLTARGAMVVDFNGDGALDLIVVNRNGPTEIWRNASTDLGNWVDVRLHQRGVNHNAIGAVLEVRADGKVQRRELTLGGGHASGQSGLFWHFGIGAAARAEVQITWPDGEVRTWSYTNLNDVITFVR